MGTLCLGSAGINLQYWWSILGSSLQNSILAKDNSGFSSASYDHFWRHRSGPHYRGLVLVCYCVWRLPWLQFRSRWSVGSSISAGRRSWWACGHISLSPGQWFVPALPSRGRPGHKWRFSYQSTMTHYLTCWPGYCTVNIISCRPPPSGANSLTMFASHNTPEHCSHFSFHLQDWLTEWSFQT